MKGLIAKRPILYRGRMYKAGENLPGDDAKMVAAWLENDSAELCGEAKSADRGGQEAAQEPENAPEVSEDQGAGNEAQGGQEPPQEGGTEDGGMIAGHLDPKDLEDLKKADLERMANDMGLDIPKAKTKADLIAAITAAEVYAPAEDENGGALKWTRWWTTTPCWSGTRPGEASTRMGHTGRGACCMWIKPTTAGGPCRARS